MTRMASQELKELVQLGLYKPNPPAIADAMLRRRGVRELLTGPQVSSAGGRSRSSEPFHPRAA
jgi:hypothetical protein